MNKQNDHKFFCNKKCKYYPCHELEDLNCLFCYCPLYHFNNCGGNFTITRDGKKDCSKCTLPHIDYDYIINFLVVDLKVSSSRNNQQHRGLTSFK
jgi:Zn-finger protein